MVTRTVINHQGLVILPIRQAKYDLKIYLSKRIDGYVYSEEDHMAPRESRDRLSRLQEPSGRSGASGAEEQPAAAIADKYQVSRLIDSLSRRNAELIRQAGRDTLVRRHCHQRDTTLSMSQRACEKSE
jgi:hypothetical protein